jgi:serine/threonine protein kinase
MKGAVLDAQPCALSICKFRVVSSSQLVINRHRTDFGISKAFTEEAGSQTEGPSSMTKMWCSPEVAAQKSRGRAADIFSLGCVFVEMYTVLVRKSSADFEDFRAQDGNNAAFHLTLPRVLQWMVELQNELESGFKAAAENDPRYYENRQPPSSLFLDLLRDMIAEDPERRPTSAEVITRLESMTIYGAAGFTYVWEDYQWECCSAPRESYRVAEEDEIYNRFLFNEVYR